MYLDLNKMYNIFICIGKIKGNKKNLEIINRQYIKGVSICFFIGDFQKNLCFYILDIWEMEQIYIVVNILMFQQVIKGILVVIFIIR